MSEINEETEMWRAYKREAKQKKDAAAEARIKRWADSYAGASALANEHGMTLRNVHCGLYSLSHNAQGWLLNLYPENGRIYSDKKRGRAPLIGLTGDWDLRDAVKAAAAP